MDKLWFVIIGIALICLPWTAYCINHEKDPLINNVFIDRNNTVEKIVYRDCPIKCYEKENEIVCILPTNETLIMTKEWKRKIK